METQPCPKCGAPGLVPLTPSVYSCRSCGATLTEHQVATQLGGDNTADCWRHQVRRRPKQSA